MDMEREIICTAFFQHLLNECLMYTKLNLHSEWQFEKKYYSKALKNKKCN